MTTKMKAVSVSPGTQISFRDGSIAVVDVYGFCNVPDNFVSDMFQAGFTIALVPNNVTATADPSATNDTTEGYAQGSTWLNNTTGRMFVCRDATDSAAVWDPIGFGDRLPFQAGRAYTPNGEILTAVLTVLDVLYAVPMYIPSRITLDKLSINVTTGQTGGVGFLAVYKDSNGTPGARVAVTAQLDCSATAVVSSAALGVSLEPGWYWLASTFSASSTQPSVAGIAVGASQPVFGALGGTIANVLAVATTNNTTGIRKTSNAYAAPAATFPSGAVITTAATTPCPAISLAA